LCPRGNFTPLFTPRGEHYFSFLKDSRPAFIQILFGFTPEEEMKLLERK
jgi:hypothetical protein